MIFDADTRRFLKIAFQIGGDPRVLYTEWTRNLGKAQRFPGVKSARGMRRKLGGNLTIISERGREIP